MPKPSLLPSNPLAMIWPQSWLLAVIMVAFAPLFAIVGPDGSGKSRLVPDVMAHLGKSRAASSGYLGLGSSDMGKKIARWPLIGPGFADFLNRRADRAREPGGRIPGLGTAIVLYQLSMKRKARFDRLLKLRETGVTVVTDRYPQIEVPGFYDGPGLSAARAVGYFVKLLAARERALYEHMAAHVPTLVLRLNIDVDTAMARSPDHVRTLVARKVDATPKLRFNGAPIVEIDARLPYETVLGEVISHIEQALNGQKVSAGRA